MGHWPCGSPHLNDVDLPDQKKRDLCSRVGPSQGTDHHTWCPPQPYRYCSQLTDWETGGREERIRPGWRTGAGTLDHVAMLPHGKPTPATSSSLEERVQWTQPWARAGGLPTGALVARRAQGSGLSAFDVSWRGRRWGVDFRCSLQPHSRQSS